MINLNDLSSYAPTIKLSDSRSLYSSNPPGLPLLQIDSESCYAVIAIQGAQLLEFRPKGQSDLLWLSPKAHFETGKAIRGGIPVCAPWFGPHKQDPSKPQHGFARNRDWQLNEVTLLDDKRHQLVFELPWSEELTALYSQPLKITLTMTLGKSLELCFEIENLSTETAEISWALHAYFPIHNLAELRISGCPEDLRFGAEVDRLFDRVDATQAINTQPNIQIQAEGSHSAIVWNPGPEKTKLLSDINDADYLNFVCVERGEVGPDRWPLNAGEKRSSRIEIRHSE